jgi:hypothetical protein
MTGEKAVRFELGKYELELIDERTYTPRSADNVRTYARVYDFGAEFRSSSRHGLILREDGVLHGSCLLSAGGGVSGAHAHSAVIVADACFVAVGDTICSLALPSLNLLWQMQVDDATCFGVYFSAKHNCLLSHGELEIARVSLFGKVMWKSGGEDIFTGGFKMFPDYVEAVDFNQTAYHIEIETGAGRTGAT